MKRELDEYQDIQLPEPKRIQTLQNCPSISQEKSNYNHIQRLYDEIFKSKDEQNNMKNVIQYLVEKCRQFEIDAKQQEEKINTLVNVIKTIRLSTAMSTAPHINCGIEYISR